VLLSHVRLTTMLLFDVAANVRFAANVLQLTRIETLPLIVIKKDNNREPYDRSKIEAGIVRSCHKRPISTAQITAIVDDIETALYNREDREIPTMVIGELVMDHLKDLDPVAYVRFASVYREFKDIDTFMDEIKSLLSSN